MAAAPGVHVAAESRPARATVRTSVNRLSAGGDAVLVDRSTRPYRSPTQLEAGVVARIDALRRERKLPPRLIVVEQAVESLDVSVVTASRWPRELGSCRLRNLAGQTIHAIPTGGGYRVHDRVPQRLGSRVGGIVA